VTRVLTAMQSLYLHLWGEKGSRPYMQSFHFAFSVGALLAPVVGKLFICSGNFCGGDILKSDILYLVDRYVVLRTSSILYMPSIQTLFAHYSV